MSLPSIQKRLDETDPGGTLAIEPGDYGPCVIAKPLILLCDGSTFWTIGDDPAVVIQSAGVVVKDANIRALLTEKNVVLTADKDNHPLFQNVRIFGRAVGIESEPCEWILPPRIDTGEITSHHPGFFIDLAVPQRSQIVCRISGLSMDPSALCPGVNTVKLHISDAIPDSILIGEIEVIGNALTRLIPFFARITTNSPPEKAGSCSQLYDIPAHEKERFQKCLAGIAPAQSFPKLQHQKSERPKSKAIPTTQLTQKQPAQVSKTKTDLAIPKKPKRSPADPTDHLKLGAAFAESAEEIRTIQRCPIYILADCSGTMPEDSIKSIMAGISAIHSELMNEPLAIKSAYLSVITFGSHAKLVVPLTDICSFTPPKLQASRDRAMGEALRLLCQNLDYTASEQKGHKTDFEPIIFLFTGGAPTDNWQQYADDLKAKRPRAIIIALKCREGADIDYLEYMTDIVFEMKNMTPGDFSSLFRFYRSHQLSMPESIFTDTTPGHKSTGTNSQEKSSLLFGGNVYIEKPLDPSNRTEVDQGKIRAERHKAPNTSKLSKLFTDPRN